MCLLPQWRKKKKKKEHSLWVRETLISNICSTTKYMCECEQVNFLPLTLVSSSINGDNYTNLKGVLWRGNETLSVKCLSQDTEHTKPLKIVGFTTITITISGIFLNLADEIIQGKIIQESIFKKLLNR